MRRKNTPPRPGFEAAENSGRRIEQIRREDEYARDEWQRAPSALGGGIKSGGGEREPDEIAPRIPHEDGCRIYVPDEKPRDRPDERRKERPDISGEREEEKPADEGDPARDAVYPVHEIKGVANRRYPQNSDEEHEGSEQNRSIRKKLRRIEKQKRGGGGRLRGRFYTEVEIHEIVREPDKPHGGRGEEERPRGLNAEEKSSEPRSRNDGDAAEARGRGIVGASRVRNIEKIPPDREADEEGDEGTRGEERESAGDYGSGQGDS